MTARMSFVVLALVLIAGSYESVKSQKTATFNGFELVDKAGNISKPTDYRDRYELLGTYTVLDPKGNQIHVTYGSPGTAEYYRKTGKFPDGAVLVKEIFGTDHSRLTTGDAYWTSGIQVWFVQIKDTKNRFPNNKLWATDGVGGFLRPTHPTSRWPASTELFRRRAVLDYPERNPLHRNASIRQGRDPGSHLGCGELCAHPATTEAVMTIPST
ncbi:MAG: hypothetical protein JWO91_83 [Acidobacteriaceae bacterium]|nr:hypothetical protein [Acidobacteriaceae bacterium]